MSHTHSLLLVDDERSLVYLLQGELQASGRFEVDIAYDGSEAINKLQSNIYDVVLLDIRMPRVDGIEVLRHIQQNCPTTQVIMLTNYADIKNAIETVKLGAYDFISKPYDYDELEATIERALERRRLSIDNELLRNELYSKRKNFQIIGRSESMQNLIERARKVAQTESIVLIQGASGTGKELIAHLIHQSSHRADRPFVVVNCASIPDTLLESELFGYERGAFTNAYNTKQGLVEVANGGTLFLDEVGDISPTIQPKLLRFVETGEFRRVGGINTMRVNVRIVSATNKDLQKEVLNGDFRQDLLYRLNVVTLYLPPLKERKEDIPDLVEHFLSVHARSYQKKKVSKETLAFLMRHDWPGNVREIEHVIEGAIILSSNDVIQPEDLVINWHLAQSYEKYSTGNYSFSSDEVHEPEKKEYLSLEELERMHITKTLEQTRWSKNKTARILGITPKTLYLKIKKYGIEPRTHHFSRDKL